MLVDSHCHLDFPDFAEDRADLIARAKAEGVGLFVTISTFVSKIESLKAITRDHPEVYASVGTHPHNAAEEPDVTAADDAVRDEVRVDASRGAGR